MEVCVRDTGLPDAALEQILIGARLVGLTVLLAKHVTILFLLLLSLLPVTVLAAGATLPDYYQDSYYAELSLMYQRLNNTEGPKIVVVGGSNVAFGLNSALLEELLAEKGFDYTVCPFGLYAAVGTSAMLDLSQNTLNEGDIVILAIEPNSETMSSYFGATAFWKCAENTPELLLAVSQDKQAALFGNYVSYLQERYSIFTSGALPQVEGVYARDSFNERCDLIYDRAGNAMPLGYDTTEPVDLAAMTIAEDFAQQVNGYCQAAEEVGAQVCMSFSPMNRTALTDPSRDAVNTYFQLCSSTFTCPIISNPNSYILDSGWFYDSNFHLNSAGAIVRTLTLAEDILAYLGCYEEVSYDLPDMPASIATAYESTAEPGYFNYEAITYQNGDTLGYRISGLTESGLTRTELTVPAVYDGRPVVGFTADALAGVTTSCPLVGSEVVFTAYTASTSVHGARNPDNSTWSQAVFPSISSSLSAYSLLISRTASAMVWPVPLSSPAKKIPNGERRSAPTKQKTSTTAITAPPPAAMTAANPWTAAAAAFVADTAAFAAALAEVAATRAVAPAACTARLRG